MKKMLLGVLVIFIVFSFVLYPEASKKEKSTVKTNDKGTQTAVVFLPLEYPTNQPPSTKVIAHYEIEMARFNDPFTPPHSKTECCKIECISTPWGDVCGCTAWCTQYQWLEVTPILIVDIVPIRDFWEDVKSCHNNAVGCGLVGGIVTAWLSGGTAGATAAVNIYIASFTDCLKAKVTGAVFSARVEFRTAWTDWRG